MDPMTPEERAEHERQVKVFLAQQRKKDPKTYRRLQDATPVKGEATLSRERRAEVSAFAPAEEAGDQRADPLGIVASALPQLAADGWAEAWDDDPDLAAAERDDPYGERESRVASQPTRDPDREEREAIAFLVEVHGYGEEEARLVARHPRLTGEEARVLALHQQGMSAVQIAKLTGKAASTTRVLLKRARDTIAG